MVNKLENSILSDYYGGLLNGHQQEILRLYYDCDMSLGEIAEELKITRQGVREVIVRSTKKLEEYENKLGLIKKVRGIAASLEEIIVKEKNGSEIKQQLKKLLSSIKEL